MMHLKNEREKKKMRQHQQYKFSCRREELLLNCLHARDKRNKITSTENSTIGNQNLQRLCRSQRANFLSSHKICGKIVVSDHRREAEGYGGCVASDPVLRLGKQFQVKMNIFLSLFTYFSDMHYLYQSMMVIVQFNTTFLRIIRVYLRSKTNMRGQKVIIVKALKAK